jgi:hypothetical protein
MRLKLFMDGVPVLQAGCLPSMLLKLPTVLEADRIAERSPSPVLGRDLAPISRFTSD